MLVVRTVAAMETTMGHPSASSLLDAHATILHHQRHRRVLSPPICLPSRTSHHATLSVHTKQWYRAWLCCPRTPCHITSPLEKFVQQFCAIDNVPATPRRPLSLVGSPSPPLPLPSSTSCRVFTQSSGAALGSLLSGGVGLIRMPCLVASASGCICQVGKALSVTLCGTCDGRSSDSDHNVTARMAEAIATVRVMAAIAAVVAIMTATAAEAVETYSATSKYKFLGAPRCFRSERANILLSN